MRAFSASMFALVSLPFSEPWYIGVVLMMVKAMSGFTVRIWLMRRT